MLVESSNMCIFVHFLEFDGVRVSVPLLEESIGAKNKI